MLHRTFRRKNADVGTWMYARQLENTSEIRPEKTRIYKYVHMKGRRVECRRRTRKVTTNPLNIDITQ